MALGRVVLVAVVLSVASACGSRSPYMRENSPPQALVPPADAALVVFLRPSKYGGSSLFHVINGEGHFVGDLNGRQYFVSVQPPGRHQFIAWGENTDTVFAVTTRDPEMDDIAPDDAFLQWLAHESSGVLYPPGELGPVQRDPSAERVLRDRTETPLWRAPLLALIVAGASGLAWIVRRRSGLR